MLHIVLATDVTDREGRDFWHPGDWLEGAVWLELRAPLTTDVRGVRLTLNGSEKLEWTTAGVRGADDIHTEFYERRLVHTTLTLWGYPPHVPVKEDQNRFGLPVFNNADSRFLGSPPISQRGSDIGSVREPPLGSLPPMESLPPTTDEESPLESSREALLRALRECLLSPRSSYGTLPMETGLYVWPFRIAIPDAPLPASYEHPEAHVRYRLVAYLDVPKSCPPEFRVRDSVRKLLVLPRASLSSRPDLLEPVTASFHKEMTSLCCVNSGAIDMTATCSRRMFLPEDEIQVEVRVENNSSVLFSGVRLRLIEHIELGPEPKTGQLRDFKKLVAENAFTELLWLDTEKPLCVSLEVPSCKPKPTFSGRFIKRYYVLSVRLLTSQLLDPRIGVHFTLVAGTPSQSTASEAPVDPNCVPSIFNPTGARRQKVFLEDPTVPNLPTSGPNAGTSKDSSLYENETSRIASRGSESHHRKAEYAAPLCVDGFEALGCQLSDQQHNEPVKVPKCASPSHAEPEPVPVRYPTFHSSEAFELPGALNEFNAALYELVARSRQQHANSCLSLTSTLNTSLLSLNSPR